MPSVPGSAAERWRRDLEAWALPDHLLRDAGESPWGWPEAVLARMREDRRAGSPGPTLDLVLGFLGEAGSVLDVGAGTGRLAVPIARRGHRVTAVEPSPEMAAEARAAAGGLPVEVIEGRWPEAAATVGRFDVALSAHVVYDVADIAPFLRALGEAAPVAVVECGADHPWVSLTPLYLALHGLDRPAGPTVEDLVGVVAEVAGVRPRVVRWRAERPLRFADRQEALAFYRRRLVLPPARTPELEALLEPRLRTEGGWVLAGDPVRESATLWWEA